MFDSIHNVNDFLSDHWLAEVFPARLKDLTARRRDQADHGKPVPVRALTAAAASYLLALAEPPSPDDETYTQALTELHSPLVAALGVEPAPTELQTTQDETPVTVPLLARVQGQVGDALHVLQARPVDALDDLFDADDAPRYLLVLAGSWLLLTDVGRWAEGRYLAFDVRKALSRRDDRATGKLAWHAGLRSADVLLPGDRELIARRRRGEISHEDFLAAAKALATRKAQG